MAINEKRFKRIEGDYLISGGEYRNEDNEIIMASRYSKKLNVFSKLFWRFALRENHDES